MDRMFKEYDSFWKARETELERIGLNPMETVTLASIVQSEVMVPSELPTVAGVYLNRIKKRMLLQADPTVIFATGDFNIRRVLNKHLEIDSPYNTYMYPGLPPGPIRNPDISSIEGVLNAESHKYLYFCAKPDFSGKHNFSETLSRHNQYAAAWQRALNQRRIYR